MQSASVTCLFCEDLREEKSEQNSLIGILPDNVEFPVFPSMMPKLAIYVRIHLDAASSIPKTTEAKLISTDGQETELPSWDMAAIEKGFSDAKSSGTPLVGLVLRAVLSPFPISKAGVLVVKVLIDGTEYVAGNLRFIEARAPASVPQALQSPTAS
jgi:hypothetical protein